MNESLSGNEAQSEVLTKLFGEIPDRRMVVAIAALAALLLIALLTIALDSEGRFAQLMLDRKSPHFIYPFTIQNLLHVIFFVGLGELFVRWKVGVREQSFTKLHLLPEDQETVLEPSDLSPIRKRIAALYSEEHGFLPSLIDLSILQFQSGRSVDQTVAVMTGSLELIQHRVDLRYSLIRYLAWLIPTLGFIGTVIGLGSTLAGVPKSGQIQLYELAQTLSVGFDCTMVALIESAVLVCFMSIAQEKEELAVNFAGTYTLRNLINRLYVG